MASVTQEERRLKHQTRMARLAPWRFTRLFQSPSGAAIRRLPIAHVVAAIVVVALGLDELLHTPRDETWQENVGTGQAATVSDASNSQPLLPALKHAVWHRPPQGTVMPPVREFLLRPEMVRFRAKDNVLIAAFASGGLKDFVHNFARHLTDIGLYNFLLCTLDHKFLGELFSVGIPVATMEGNGSMPERVVWGSTAFKDLGEHRIALARAVLETGTELLLSDVDVLWLRNPLPFMARYPGADLLASSDGFMRTRDDEGLEVGRAVGLDLNIGVMFFRPREPTMQLLQNWTGNLHVTINNKYHAHVEAQPAMNMALWDNYNFTDEYKSGEYFLLFGRSLKVGILPISIFASGPTFFILRHYLVTGLQPYSIHTTYTCDVWTKRSRMREIKQFYDPPEYYDPPNGLLAFDLNIPPELLDPEGNDTQTNATHAKLVEYQLHHIRQAFALATILNRTLVLPRVYCFYHGVTWRWRGAWMYDNQTLIKEPFLCPVDQMTAMWKLKHMSEDKGPDYSPPVDFREYSFLDNPRTPNKVRNDKVTVKLCDPQVHSCKDIPPKRSFFKREATMQMQRRPSQMLVVAELKPLSQFKLVHVLGLEDAFGGWDNTVDERKFTLRADESIHHIRAEDTCRESR